MIAHLLLAVLTAVAFAGRAEGDFGSLDLQAKIDAAVEGEVVRVSPGQWVTKPFRLKSGVTLELAEGAVLLASTNIADYAAAEGGRCFIFAEGATNVAIVGKGTINGRGWAFKERKGLKGESQPQALPVMMRFSRCRGLRLEGFTYRDCGAWGCHLRNCDGVTVRRVACFNHVNNTNDGIDIESCNVVVEDCDIDSDDDAVVFKTESDKSFPVTNVIVRNCRLASCCNAVKFGTGSYCDFRDIVIENCTLVRPRASFRFDRSKQTGRKGVPAGLAGLALEVVDGGRMENVTVRNATVEGYLTPVFLRLGRRHDPQPRKETYLRNVLIENVSGTADSRLASSICGVPGLCPENVVLRNCKFVFPGGGTVEDVERAVPEREAGYPECTMFGGNLPAWAFFVRHAKGVIFDNVRLMRTGDDARQEIVTEDAPGFMRRTSVTASPSARASERVLSDGWEFRLDGQKAWRPVRIPHDWAIAGPFARTNDLQCAKIVQDGETVEIVHTGRTGALPHVGIGWYRRTIELPTDAREAELVFDGAMACPEVYSDGVRIGGWKNGYAPFAVKLPLRARQTITVRLENLPSGSRWYPGAGIYRPVTLRIDPTYRPEEVFVRTEKIENGVAHLRVTGPDVARTFTVDNPKLWTPETPHLYVLEPEGIRYGIRTVDWRNGAFELNGVRRKFKGVCLHHDLGPLGAAFSRAAFRRQVRMLKDMGCDSIRTAHNIPSREQLEICDEEGMMVIAESFDEWKTAKCANGYHLFFDTWWQRDIEALVKFSRNHPSVVMWSIGNEIWEDDPKTIVEYVGKMTALCHRLDPTRPVTMGIDRPDAMAEIGALGLLDIPGLNYRLGRYEIARAASACGAVLGTETASTVSTRGAYPLPVEPGKNVQRPDGQCSSYDVECCPWSNLPDEDFVLQDDCPWVMGEFVWTGFDYLGEPTPYKEYWPSRSSYFGIIDLAGIPKDRYYLYRSRWNTKSPTLHVVPHWTWSERPSGQTLNVPVYVYTSYPTAELFVNGRSWGRREKMGNSGLDRYRLRWNDVTYEPGELKAVAYDEVGRTVATEIVRTAGSVARVAVEAEPFLPDDDVRYFRIRLVDASGTICPNASNRLAIAVSGGGAFQAACNGDPTSLERFVVPEMRAFHGELTVLVRPDGSGRPIEVAATDLDVRVKIVRAGTVSWGLVPDAAQSCMFVH